MLNTIAEQIGVEFEHLIINGPSPDGMLDRVRDRPHPKMHPTREPDGGIDDALKKVITRATDEIVELMQIDTFFAHDDALANVARALEKSGADAICDNLDMSPPVIPFGCSGIGRQTGSLGETGPATGCRHIPL